MYRRRTAALATLLAATLNLWGASSAPIVHASGGTRVSAEAHHDTSPPLRTLRPDPSTVSHPHAARAAHPASRRPAVSSPDTSGNSALGPSGPRIPGTVTNVDGIASGMLPPDNQVAAGPTEVVEIVNVEMAVYDKAGGVVLAPRLTNALWAGFGGGCQQNNDGDATVVFDALAQRWVINQISITTTPYLDCVAVSTGIDATGTYNRYSFSYNEFPDYPKLGVWPDAYYITFNLFNPNTFVGAETCAYDRASMLSGLAATQQCFLPNTSYWSFLPASIDGTATPAPGTSEWLLDIDALHSNALAQWKFHVDWTTPANSTLSGPTSIAVNAFSEACGGFGTCIPQPGTSQQLDSIGDRLMNRLVYRNHGGTESLMVSHSVVSGTSVGERWYELRPSGGNLTVFQQGTYAPDASYRWMGSIAMDQSGDMALGYSLSSSAIYPSVDYTGRLAGDALGTMPQGEGSIIAGSGSQTGLGISRWGDYSEMSVDPSDNCTFWYSNEYYTTSGLNWSTRIGSWKFPSCVASTNWAASLSASATSVPTNATVTLTALSSFDVGAASEYLEIYDQSTNQSVAICSTGYICTGTVSHGANQTRGYIAYVAGHSTTNPPPSILATASSLSVTWTWTVSLSSSASDHGVGDNITLTATANADVALGSLYLEIYDQSTNQAVAVCSSDSVCSGTTTKGSSQVTSYIAYVAGHSNSNPPPSIDATSNTVSVRWWALTINASSSPNLPLLLGSVVFTATSSWAVDSTPWQLSIYDTTSNVNICTTSSGTTCVTSQAHIVPQCRTYVAVVSDPTATYPPTGLVASSSPIVVSWEAVNLPVVGQCPITLPFVEP